MGPDADAANARRGTGIKRLGLTKWHPFVLNVCLQRLPETDEVAGDAHNRSDAMRGPFRHPTAPL
jgi:hypothetical protein